MADAPFSRRQLTAALSSILLLAFAVPAVTATCVNRARVARAQEQVGRIAEAVRASAPGGLAGIDVLAGSGEIPKARHASRWLDGRTDWLSTHVSGVGPDALRPDPWNNRLLVNVGAAGTEPIGGDASRAVWVLSAGPNGVIETPYDQPGASATLGGDDVGVRVR